jgi:DNA-binding MarR family transcriptional regulator
VPDVSTEAAKRLLLVMARFGRTVSQATADAASDPELADSTSLTVLCTLDLDGPRRPGVLQEITGLSSGGVSKLLDRMEEAKVVKRSYGAIAGDNRGVLVSITPKGRRQLRSIAEALARRLPDSKLLVKEVSGALQR